MHGKILWPSDCMFDGCQVDRRQPLGESDLLLHGFYAFLQALPTQDNKGPLLLCNFLERLDESVDLQPVFQALRTIDRQVFLILSRSYLIEKLRKNENRKKGGKHYGNRMD